MKYLYNKKGASLAGFSEVAVFFILIMAVFLVIVANMNVLYDKNYDSTFGINQGDLKNRSISYQANLERQIESGEASTNTLTGVSLTTIWAMIKAGITYTMQFITGSWIESIVSNLSLGDIGNDLALVLRILFSLSVGYIAIKLIMKVKP